MSKAASVSRAKTAGDAESSARTQATQVPLPASAPSLIAAALGGLIVATAVTLAVLNASNAQGIAGQTTLTQVGRDDIIGAASTLAPNVAMAMAQDALTCKTRLASAVLTNAPGQAPRTVRLRSGNYLSPSFTLTDVPQRIAFPFPAAYELGKGLLIVEGAQNGTTIGLFPTLTVNTSTASFTINLWWQVKTSC